MTYILQYVIFLTTQYFHSSLGKCCLRAGSPLSHARKRRRAKRFGGMGSSEEAPSPGGFALAATTRALFL